jgi:hypothetical protein
MSILFIFMLNTLDVVSILLQLNKRNFQNLLTFDYTCAII